MDTFATVTSLLTTDSSLLDTDSTLLDTDPSLLTTDPTLLDTDSTLLDTDPSLLDRALEVGGWGRQTVILLAVGLALWQIGVFATGAIFRGTQLLPAAGQGRSQLISHNARDVVEMSFWVIKFIEDFEKELDWSEKRAGGSTSNGRSAVDVKGGEGLFSNNARTVMKMMRYVSKFLGTFDTYNKHAAATT